MKSFIRAVELWIPNEDRRLEFGGGLYEDELREFREISELALFSFDEGLPGKAWAAGHPIIFTDLATSYFKRADEARLSDLAYGIAIPFFVKDDIRAVIGFLGGSGADSDVGTVELWHNDAGTSHELSLIDGYYANIDEFEYNSRQMRFPRGYGLPGSAWKKGGPTTLKELQSRQFLRAQDAALSGIKFGLAVPFTFGDDASFVMTFFSGVKMPIARRFEIWNKALDGSRLTYETGYCAGNTDLEKIFAGQFVEKGQGALGESWATGMPVIKADLTNDASVAARAAAKGGLSQMAVMPIFHENEFSSAIAIYF